MQYVTYTRLSKEKNDRSQHGHDSQLADINYFLDRDPDAVILGSFSEFVSGAADVKPELSKAMALCKEHNATLLVSKLDRLSRRVSQIALLMESEVNFKVAVIPSANNFQLHLYAAFAEEERTSIRDRIKRGLKAAKAKGVKIGTASEKYKLDPNNPNNVSKAAAKERAEKLRIPLQNLINTSTKPTLQVLANGLTRLKQPRPNGFIGQWDKKQVSRVLTKLNISIKG